MTIRSGYKATEIGTIPQDWAARSLASFQPFITSGSRGWAKYYSDRGDPFLRITNLSREAIYPNLSNLKRVSLPPNENEGIRTGVRSGDVLISITADIGIIGYVDERIPSPAYISQHLATVRFGADVNSKFLSYFLASAEPQRRIRATTDAGAKAGMSLSGVAQLLAAFPPTLTEQNAIADALSGADQCIAALDAVIVKKRALKAATMQALLKGERRLPGFTRKWERFSFDRIAKIRNEKVQTFGLDEASFCIELEQIESANGRIAGHTDARGRQSIKYRFRGQDILFGRLRPYLKKHWLADRSGVCSTEIWPLVAISSTSDPLFLNALVQGEQFIKAASMAYGTHMPRADWPMLAQLEMNIPVDREEQFAIGELLADVDSELVAIEATAAKMRQVKSGMMQQLLTGKIRLT